MSDDPKIHGMLLFIAEGPRSIDDRDVLFVYREATVTASCNATLVMANRRGRARVDGCVDALQARLADITSPSDTAMADDHFTP